MGLRDKDIEYVAKYSYRKEGLFSLLPQERIEDFHRLEKCFLWEAALLILNLNPYPYKLNDFPEVPPSDPVHAINKSLRKRAIKVQQGFEKGSKRKWRNELMEHIMESDSVNEVFEDCPRIYRPYYSAFKALCYKLLRACNDGSIPYQEEKNKKDRKKISYYELYRVIQTKHLKDWWEKTTLPRNAFYHYENKVGNLDAVSREDSRLYSVRLHIILDAWREVTKNPSGIKKNG